MEIEEIQRLADGSHSLLSTGAESVKVARSNAIIRLLAQIALNTSPKTK